MKKSLPSVVSVVQNQCKSILNHCQSSFPRSSDRDNLLFELQRSSATDAAMVKIKLYGTMYSSHYGDGQVIVLQANLSHDNFPASSFLQAVCSHQYRFSDLALLLCPLLKISSCFPSPMDFPQLVRPFPAQPSTGSQVDFFSLIKHIKIFISPTQPFSSIKQRVATH